MHHRIDARSHAVLTGHLVGVYTVKFQVFVDNLLLHFSWQLIPHLIGRVGSVQQENRSGSCLIEHFELLQELELVAGHKIGFLNQVGRPDRVGTEPQVRNRSGARFLRVVHEIALCVVVGIIADDLDRVLIGTDRTVGTKTEKQSLEYLLVTVPALGLCKVETRVGDVVMDADREMILWLLIIQLLKDAFNHPRSKLFGRKPEPTVDDGGFLLKGFPFFRPVLV